MNRIAVLIVGLAVAVGVNLRAEDAPEAEETVQIPAIESVKKVQEGYLAVIKVAKDKYIKVLQSLSDAEQKKGNLDGIEELKPEIEKMSSPEAMTSNADFKNSGAKKAQDAYRKEIDSVKIKYISDLQKAQAEEVKAGKIDNAKMIKAYIATLKSPSGEVGKADLPEAGDVKNDIKDLKTKGKSGIKVVSGKSKNEIWDNKMPFKMDAGSHTINFILVLDKPVKKIWIRATPGYGSERISYSIENGKPSGLMKEIEYESTSAKAKFDIEGIHSGSNDGFSYGPLQYKDNADDRWKDIPAKMLMSGK